MFALDIETLGDKQRSVILSLAVLYFDEKEIYTYQELLDNTCFVKFNIKEQMTLYKRLTDKPTIDWWKKQCDIVKEVSLIPSNKDIKVVDGLKIARDYIKDKGGKDEIVWTRGSLDQFAIDSLTDDVSSPRLFEYGQYRDFRTAIDLLKNTSKRGYCNVPNFNKDLVMKHDPVHDVAYDVMMLLYGE